MFDARRANDHWLTTLGQVSESSPPKFIRFLLIARSVFGRTHSYQYKLSRRDSISFYVALLEFDWILRSDSECSRKPFAFTILFRLP